ncbi:MAG: 2OG-Fe(II) oxygenase [Hyphomicrobiaceae bacterium]
MSVARRSGSINSVPEPNALGERIAALDWSSLVADLDARGSAVARGLIEPSLCRELTQGYDDDGAFRSRIFMARHGFGKGEYKYFAYPLPDPVATLRTLLYPRLAPIANAWMARLKSETRFPAEHAAFIARCHAAGQLRPTPLLLRYAAGDYNCLHQDLYGPTVFPIQVAILLAEPGRDFTGGEFVLVEQRPRMQSRAEVIALGQGDAVMFVVNERPVAGAKGDYRVKLRHGVSRLITGRRHTLGIIFHDAA